VEVRLAHEQGLIHQRDLNHFQHWALRYWIYLDRRQANDDRNTLLELQCFNESFERWHELYGQFAPSDQEDEDVEIPVEDIDELNRWYESMEQQRTMSGASAAPPDWGHGGQWPSDEKYGDWK
jgi:hypothetical protein